MNNFQNRKSTRIKGFDYSTARPYFITICTAQKREYFIDEEMNSKIIKCLREEKERSGFSVFVYCLMPDHLHLLISPPGDGVNVSEFVGRFKGKTTYLAWPFDVRGKLWQGRFYDHVVRKKEDMKRIAEYILNNPVRQGIVKKWEDYKYCGLLDKWRPYFKRWRSQKKYTDSHVGTGFIPVR